MSTTVQGGGGEQIDGLIKSYLANPDKNTKAKTKALNTIEKQVDLLRTHINNLEGELEKGYTRMQLGSDGVNMARVTDIEKEIGELKGNLLTLNIQLAKLSKYKKSQKLAGAVLQSGIALSDLESRAQLIKKALTDGVPQAGKLKQEIYDLLERAEKKTNRKQSGELLEEAIEKYKALEKMKGQLDPNQLSTDLKAIQVKMSLIADKRLPLTNSEVKFYKKKSNTSGLSESKKEKIELLNKRISISRTYFSDSPAIQKQAALQSGSVPTTPLYVPTNERRCDDPALGIDDQAVKAIGKRFSKHSLTKKEKMRTKISVSHWQQMRQGGLSKIAKRVHEIGKLQMRAMAELSRVQTEYSKGAYKIDELDNDIAAIKGLIKETEREIAELQVAAASKSSTTLTKKVHKAIAANRTLLEALRKKEANLEVISAKEYEQASSELQTIRDNTALAIEDPKKAGIAMFAAYTAFEKLKSYVELSTHSDPKVSDAIDEMSKVADALIKSANAENVLKLSKKDSSYTIDLLNAPEKGLKLKNDNDTAKQLTRILANKITQAQFAPSGERSKSLCEVAEILDYITAKHPEIWGKLRESPELKPLVSNYENRLVFANLQKAASHRKHALVCLAMAKKEPKRAPYYVNKAMGYLKQVETLEGQTKDQKDALNYMASDLKRTIKSRSADVLVLSKDKKGVRKKLIEGELKPLQRIDLSEKEQAQIVRYRQVLANEMLRAVLGHEQVMSKEMAATYESGLGSKKDKIKRSLADDMLDNLDNKPEIFQKMAEDKEFLEIDQAYRLHSSEGQVNQMKGVFVKWTKYALQKDQIDRGVLNPNENVKKDILAKAKENEQLLLAAMKELQPLVQKMEKSPAGETLELRELKSLMSDVNQFQQNAKSADPTQALEKAVEYAVQFRSIDDDQGIAEAVMVQAFNADNLRNPPDRVGVNNLVKEFERLKSRDSANSFQWQEMINLAREYEQVYKDAGDIFKPLYEQVQIGEYDVKRGAQLNSEQIEHLGTIDAVQNKIDKRLDEIQFKNSEFSPIQMAYPLRFQAAISQRRRALGKLQALLPKDGANPVSQAVQNPNANSREQAPPPRTFGMPPRPSVLPERSAALGVEGNLTARQQVSQLYQNAFRPGPIVGKPNSQAVQKLKAEIQSRFGNTQMQDRLDEFSNIYNYVDRMYANLYTQQGSVKGDAELTGEQARFLDWMKETHGYLEQQLQLMPSENSDFQQAHINGFKGVLAEFKRSLNDLDRLPRSRV